MRCTPQMPMLMRRRKLSASIAELTEARRQIASMLHKLKASRATLESKENPERYKSQITLATRRIKALELANDLIENEINR